MRVLVICSGGIDSVTLAHLLRSQYYEVDLVHFHYGQRSATQEMRCVARCRERLGGWYYEIPLQHALGAWILHSSALTDKSIALPRGDYTAESLKVTVVPHRNAIFANLAVGIAANKGHQYVALGVHAGDHPIYSDCRPEFISALMELVGFSLGEAGPKILAPFLYYQKSRIIQIGEGLARGGNLDSIPVPWKDTWSCYDGGGKQCGECSTCTERRKAFQLAGVTDPTTYADAE